MVDAHRQGPPPRTRRKRGPKARHRPFEGGMTTKILASRCLAISCASCFCRDSASTRWACAAHRGIGLRRADRRQSVRQQRHYRRSRRTRRQGRHLQHPRRAKPLAIDEEMYKWRHLIENFFGRLKSSNVSQCALTRRSELRLHDPSGRSVINSR